MINLTVRLSKKIITVFSLFLAIVFLMFLDYCLSGNNNGKVRVGQLSQRIDYISALGYGVDESSEQINEIYVPNNFDETFYAFNKDLKAQGFDLEKIKGETIKRYMYKAASGENISIFVYNNTLVGYDIRED
ncbi:MAG: DUF4830 domain-containing protein [Clostridia bacterium]|nr:DUF4830 domain-containing protein [Clostridia bacterium]